MKLLSLLAFLTSAFGLTQEPLTPAELERTLTNGTRKQWRETGKDLVMDNKSCLGSPTIYVFSRGNPKNSLTIQACTNGQWSPSRHSWKITLLEGETVLLVDEGTSMARNYPIRIIAKDPTKKLQDGNQQLQLTIQGTSQDQPTQYIRFE